MTACNLFGILSTFSLINDMEILVHPSSISALVVLSWRSNLFVTRELITLELD